MSSQHDFPTIFIIKCISSISTPNPTHLPWGWINHGGELVGSADVSCYYLPTGSKAGEGNGSRQIPAAGASMASPHLLRSSARIRCYQIWRFHPGQLQLLGLSSYP